MIAETKQTPQVPIPPEIDPPCQQCDNPSGAPSDSETAAAGFVTYAEDPELDDVTYLLQIEGILEANGASALAALSPAAQQCLAQFDSQTIDDGISRAGDHLFNGKVIPMAQQYDTDTKRAYAGMRLLLDVGQKKQLILGNGGQGSAAAADEEQALQLAETWASNVADSVDRDIFSTHRFNLCPSYLNIFRDLETLGGPSTNMDAYLKAVQKMQDQLHFDIDMDLHAVGPASDGGGFDITWNLKSTMKVDLKLRQGCYTPELDNDKNLQVSVEHFSMHAQDGTSVKLVSPAQFTAPVAFVTLSLCDKSPRLVLHFTSFGPADEIEAKGHSTKTDFFGGMFQGAINSPVANAVIGGGPNSGTGSGSGSGSSESSSSGSGSGGGAPSPTPSPTAKPTANAAIKQKMLQIQAEIQAHKSDVNWLMGPQGQAAIAQLQTLAGQQAAVAEAAAGPGVAQALAKTNTLDMMWNNGTTDPVDQEFKITTRGLTDTLHVTVKQSPK